MLFGRNFSLVNLYQDFQTIMICQKTWPPGRGLFTLYTYVENFKKSSCQKRLDWFQYNFAEIFLRWLSTKIVSCFVMTARGQGLYWLYICIENFKILSETTEAI